MAVSSFVFIFIATVTGIILALEPINERVQDHAVADLLSMSLTDVTERLDNAYEEVYSLKVDANGFLIPSALDLNGDMGDFYIDPRTGKKIGEPTKQHPIFEFATTLHRSLFLKGFGRFLVGLNCFLLFLIAITGMVLIVRRQKGLRHFFSKMVREDFLQHYHVYLGRLSLIPILIITLTGSYLSLQRFGLIPEIDHKNVEIDVEQLREQPVLKPSEFPIFRGTTMNQVRSMEFPFGPDVEDFYTLRLRTKELVINQYTGDVLGETPFPLVKLLADLSLFLHTGKGSIPWALVLGIASCNFLFFIYSGFAMTFRRRATRIKNRYKSLESEIIFLVGSENGSTLRFANAVHQQLLAQKQLSFLTELGNYTIFPKAKNIIVFTSTHGSGNHPSNATKAIQKITKEEQDNTINTSVIGYGSLAYPDFCAFAKKVDALLLELPWANPILPLYTVNDKSSEQFAIWLGNWGQKVGINVSSTPTQFNEAPSNLQKMKILDRSPIDHDQTFTLTMRPKSKRGFTSGDLLAIYPENDNRERLYSIARVGNTIQLAIKLHLGGLGSGYLNRLEKGSVFNARILRNPSFHFPKSTKTILMISNGTGIAPFLGMICQNKQKKPTSISIVALDETR